MSKYQFIPITLLGRSKKSFSVDFTVLNINDGVLSTSRFPCTFFLLPKNHKKTPPEPDYADMELIFLAESSSVSSAWSITWSFAGVSGNVAVSGIS